MTDSRKTFALVGCSKKKRVSKNSFSDFIPARELYTSDLFQKRVSHVEGRGLPWFILSAKSGCIAPITPLRLYDIKMGDKAPIDVAAWHVGAASQFVDLLYHDWDIRDLKEVEVEFHAGSNYSKPLADILVLLGIRVILPVRGMGIGQQLKHYKESVSS
jgi:hypothetical protein